MILTCQVGVFFLKGALFCVMCDRKIVCRYKKVSRLGCTDVMCVRYMRAVVHRRGAGGYHDQVPGPEPGSEPGYSESNPEYEAGQQK